MYLFMLISAIAAGADAIVCFHGICDTLEKRPELQCEGGIIPNGGFCQCFDVCAKVEGEICETRPIRGRESLGTCDEGLTCRSEEHMIIGAGKCTKVEDNSSSKQRAVPERTMCQLRRLQYIVTYMIIKRSYLLSNIKTPWNTPWMANCDEDGLFTREQCDVTHTCFCVDQDTGEIDETTKSNGSATCVAKRTVTPTLCEQKRNQALLTMIVYKGKWVPECDVSGLFHPEQCDNTGTCFCVDVSTGVVNESTRVIGSADCS